MIPLPRRRFREILGRNLRQTETFQTAFSAFSISIGKEKANIIANIQYYHECARGVQDDQQINPVGEQLDNDDLTEVNLSNPMEIMVEDQSEITEKDIERAKINRWPLRDILFGTTGLAIAEDIGVFDADLELPRISKGIRRATANDLPHFQRLENIVKTMLRKPRRNRIHKCGPQTLIEHGGAYSLTLQPGIAQNDVELFVDCPEANDLNFDQRIAFDIIADHLEQHVKLSNPPQLLMIVTGQGGTGKSKLIEAIDALFDYNELYSILAKTATTGIAASLIDGETVHSFAGISGRTSGSDKWSTKKPSWSKSNRSQNLSGIEYVIIDEFSMLTLDMLAMLSEIMQSHKSAQTGCNATLPFGGMNIILFGDLHQFPPVGKKNSALYTQNPKSKMGLLGRNIYLQFNTVIELKQQMRMTDKRWIELLERSREGECSEDDMGELQSLIVTNPLHELLDFKELPWNNSILVTSRHSLRVLWNASALKKHCAANDQLLFVIPAEDRIGPARLKPTMEEKLLISQLKPKKTEYLDIDLEIALGMKTMITINVATKGDLANGSRGIIADIILDAREPDLEVDQETNKVMLKYPPAMILLQPEKVCSKEFEGVEKGLIPVFPIERGFSMKSKKGLQTKVQRRQYPLTAAYAFTDYKSQGQTIEHVIVDLAKPPTGELTGFSAYVALSRSRGRQNIRLLRDFDSNLFTTHPSEDLRWEDVRQKELDIATRKWWTRKSKSRKMS